MFGKIEDYNDYLSTSGWERLGKNIWHDDDIYMFNVYDSYDEFKKNNKNIKHGDEYLYCIELDDNYIKVGFSSDLKTRMKTHLEKKSTFFSHDHRIGILGPLQDGYESEQMLHMRFSSFSTDVETYYLHDDYCSFDAFMIMFQCFQTSLMLGEDTLFQAKNLIKVKQ